MLVVYHAGFSYTQTIYDYLTAFSRFGSRQVDFFNIDQRYVPEFIDFSGYDVVLVNFCAISTTRSTEKPLLERIIPALSEAPGCKILSVQDEYDFTDAIRAFIRRGGFDVVLTCVPPEGVSTIYPQKMFAKPVRFETVMTGYIDDALVAESRKHSLPLSLRQIPLGYRGRSLPYRLGDLARHKTEVAIRFSEACERRNIPCDIAVDEKSRFHGMEWIDFIRRCRVMLGTPSGGDVFDFDGSLHRMTVERYRANPDLKYEDVREFVMKRVQPFTMAQMAPRHFEAIACGTALALVRGRYSGVLEPDEHYVPIEPDYSNIDAVLDRVLDIDEMQAMAARASSIIGRFDLTYPGFVSLIDDISEEVIAKRPGWKRVERDLPVTRDPLGHDPYMVNKLMELRHHLQNVVTEVIGQLQTGKLEAIPNPEGGYRLVRFDGPR